MFINTAVFTFLTDRLVIWSAQGSLPRQSFPEQYGVQSKNQSAVLYTAALIAFKDLRELPDEFVSARLRCQQTLPEAVPSPVPGGASPIQAQH